MKELKFRCLRAEDVNARVQKLVAGKGAILLLYKDARCDMAMLDEAVGAFNWKREREEKETAVRELFAGMCSDGKFDMLLSWLDREGYFFMTED